MIALVILIHGWLSRRYMFIARFQFNERLILELKIIHNCTSMASSFSLIPLNIVVSREKRICDYSSRFRFHEHRLRLLSTKRNSWSIIRFIYFLRKTLNRTVQNKVYFMWNFALQSVNVIIRFFSISILSRALSVWRYHVPVNLRFQ